MLGITYLCLPNINWWFLEFFTSLKFLNFIGLWYMTFIAARSINLPLFDKNIVMTGFRNKELEEKIKGVGGKNASSVNSKTFVLLVKSLEDTSSKIEEAKKLEVRIMIPDDFIREYEL